MQSPDTFLDTQRARVMADAGTADLSREPWRSRLHLVDSLRARQWTVQGLMDALTALELGARRGEDQGFDAAVTQAMALMLLDRYEADRGRVQG